MSRKRQAQVPGQAAWRGYEEDLDVRHTHKLIYGKSIDEVLEYFAGGRVLMRPSELLYAPRLVAANPAWNGTGRHGAVRCRASARPAR